MNKNPVFLLLIVFLLGCDFTQRVDRSKIKEEMANRELKKVTEAEILNEAKKIGQEITQASFNLMVERSTKAVEANRTHSIDKHQIEWVHSLDTLENTFGAKIDFLNFVTNPENLSAVELEVWEAYRYDVEQGNELSENVQKMGDGYLLYTSPLIISEAACTKCHNQEERALLPEISNFLEANYSDSKILNHKIGDVIGMWNIRLSQKKIVQKM